MHAIIPVSKESFQLLSCQLKNAVFIVTYYLLQICEYLLECLRIDRDCPTLTPVQDVRSLLYFSFHKKFN